ncbi:MAG: hypothetical protein KY455_07460 [Euryarchaeota archaeon]|nr:hypothetical protein [Euryarchaeota archaeon]
MVGPVVRFFFSTGLITVAFVAVVPDAPTWEACMEPGVEITAEEAVARGRRGLVVAGHSPDFVAVQGDELGLHDCRPKAGPLMQQPHDPHVGNGLAPQWTVTYTGLDGTPHCVRSTVRAHGVVASEPCDWTGGGVAPPHLWPHDLAPLLKAEPDWTADDGPEYDTLYWHGGDRWLVQDVYGPDDSLSMIRFNATTGEISFRMWHDLTQEHCDETGCHPPPPGPTVTDPPPARSPVPSDSP